MVRFFLSKEDWYTKRDNRTKELIGGFNNFSLGVIIDDEQISNFSIQIMSLIALNIFSRWCRNIKIEVHKTLISCIPNYEGVDFIDLLKKVMKNADPYGNFSFGDINENDYNEIIIIGKTKKKLNKPHVWINSSGWISGITYGSSIISIETNAANPIGPAFAACLGVAEVFRQAVSIFPKKYYSEWFSLYDFKFDLNPYNLKNPNFSLNFDFGRIYQIGYGAVGSSLSFLFSLTNWKGEIVIVDFDTVDYTNCNRSLIFNAYDAYKAKNKVDVCLKVLKKCSFSTKAFKGSYSDFIKKENYLNMPPDLILCLANEQNVWSTIQNNFPPIVLHATTTSNWGLNFGRHIPKKEWCIMCRFSKEMKQEFTPPCSEGKINLSEHSMERVQGVLPFLSPASAIIIFSEIAKMNTLNYPVNGDFIQFSMRSPGQSFVKMQFAKKYGCICNNQTLDLYPKEMKQTRFWSLVKV